MFAIAPAVGMSGGYQIRKSLRFNSNDASYMSRTFASGNQKTWTWSGWVKQGSLGSLNTTTSQGLFGSNPNGVTSSTPAAYIGLNNTMTTTQNDGGFTVWSRDSGSTQMVLTSNQLFRDVGGWYHVVVTIDTTLATASDRAKVWVNGQQITSWVTSTYPTQNANLQWNIAQPHSMGHMPLSANWARYLNGCLAEVVFVDGQALTADSFGKIDSTTGQWVPKKYTGTYGTNGFYLPFDDGTSTTTLGYDRSGNANNWTLTNFSVVAGINNDWFSDTPSNNYCTINPLSKSSSTITNGNLTTAGTNFGYIGTQSMTSGKWYWEVTTVSNNSSVGVIKNISSELNTLGGTYLGSTANGYGYGWNGTSPIKLNNNVLTSYGVLHGTQTISILLDLDAGTLTYWTAGVSDGVAFSGLSGEFFPAGSDAANWNFGQRPFAYTPPAGYKTLCTKDMSDPTIKLPKSLFDIKTYNGATTDVTVSGLNFAPDFVWIKSRNNLRSHGIFDTTRGVLKMLSSDLIDSEDTSTNTLKTFTSDGFIVGQNNNVGRSTDSYVAWNWKAGTGAVSNTAGSINSTVNVNPTDGFSIITYTGSGAGSATVGHGLGAAPKFFIIKQRNGGTYNWLAYHAETGAGSYLTFSGTNAVQSDTTMWSNTTPTSTTITLSSGGNTVITNPNTGTMLIYAFAEVPGFSKFGKYTGNGSTDGSFVHCGFRPAYVMVKRTDATTNWEVMDATREPRNVMLNELYPNSASTENASTADELDFLSNGFKLRSTNAIHNASGGTYIFMALAEAPFKYSNAR